MSLPRGRLAQLPSGLIAEVVDTDGPRLDTVVLATGERVDIPVNRVVWLEGDA